MARSSMAATAFTALVLVLQPISANAQSSAHLQPGARIRVWVPEPYLQEQGPWKRQQLRGTVASMSGDTLHVAVPGAIGTLAIVRQSISRLEVSRGKPSRIASAIERAFAGAVVGAISIALDNDPRGSEWPNYPREWRAAGEGAKWGAAFGAVVGFVLPTERWRRLQ